MGIEEREGRVPDSEHPNLRVSETVSIRQLNEMLGSQEKVVGMKVVY